MVKTMSGRRSITSEQSALYPTPIFSSSVHAITLGSDMSDVPESMMAAQLGWQSIFSPAASTLVMYRPQKGMLPV